MFTFFWSHVYRGEQQVLFVLIVILVQWHLTMSAQSSTKGPASILLRMLDGRSRRPTAHILGNAKEPHLLVTVPQELNSQTPLGEVALLRLRAGRAWASTLQYLPLLLVAILSVMAAHVSLFPKLVAAIVE